MKTFHKVVTSLLLIVLGLSHLKAEKLENSLIWEITGNGLEKPSYLFGTVHIIDSVYFFMDEIVKEKIESSDKVVFEIDMDQPDFQQKSIAPSMMEDKTLDAVLTKKEYEKVDSFFLKKFGFSIIHLKNMKPFYISGAIEALSLPKSAKSYEAEFMKIAHNKEIEVLGISTIEAEGKCINSIPLKTQVELLLQSIDDYDKFVADRAERMKLFKNQDIEALYKVFTKDIKDNETVFNALFPNRHDIWIPNMKELMNKHSCFFAVGVGHLPGKQGVIELLRKEGYTLKPIKK